jgi:hypothetical protein
MVRAQRSAHASASFADEDVIKQLRDNRRFSITLSTEHRGPFRLQSGVPDIIRVHDVEARLCGASLPNSSGDVSQQVVLFIETNGEYQWEDPGSTSTTKVPTFRTDGNPWGIPYLYDLKEDSLWPNLKERGRLPDAGTTFRPTPFTEWIVTVRDPDIDLSNVDKVTIAWHFEQKVLRNAF